MDDFEDEVDDIQSILEEIRLTYELPGDDSISSQLARSEKLKMCTLQEYDVPRDILLCEQNKHLVGGTTPKEMAVKLAQTTSTMDKSIERGYVNAFKKMLQFEEAAQSQYVIQFNVKEIRLKRSDSDSEREFCIAHEPKLAGLFEAVEESAVDCFTLKPSNTLISGVPMAGHVKTCNKDFIFVEITEKDHGYYIKNHPDRNYDMFFHVNRVTFQLQHFALERMTEHQLFNVFVNSPTFDSHGWNFDEPAGEANADYTFRGTLASKLNAEQKLAAANIVQARSQPLPYLLFGPAGTGKTRTLVAAIEEIVRSTTNSVLVCANSNSACDEIVTRLIGVLEEGEMFRMYGKSYDHRKVSKTIKPICNWLKGEFRFPSLEFLYRFRVLVCTLTTAGCLTRATDNPHFSSRHFSHVIIDESASTHETVSMIPIAGLCTSYGQLNASIVLAGDPKQLDAVTKSDFAIQLGFKTSFMERLFEKQLYKRDAVTDQFNPKYICQLVKNYRSHPTILAIPNQLFYDNKLEAKASIDSTHLFIGSQLLPSKNFPIIFKQVRGYCKKSDKDFSMFNMKEVFMVMEYIKKLLVPGAISQKPITQSDIGVVTPYRLQCKIIARECRKNDLKDVTIGTAEVFQGQERPVMIVSTVRSDGQLGFVKNPRRLNVIITRAKALLIIVGDYKTLCTDPNWHKLAYYCYENNAVIP